MYDLGVDRETYHHADIIKAMKTVQSLLRSTIKNGRLSLAQTKHGLAFYTNLQTIERIRPSEPVERAVFDVIVTHAYAAEKIGPGAFDRCIQELTQCSFDKDEGFHYLSSLNSLCDTVMHGVQHATMSDMAWVLETVSNDSRSLVREALNLSGFAGHICIEKAPSHVTSVELTRGHVFMLNPLFGSPVTLDRPRILCIDGYIEAVSELHHLLNAVSETREPFLLFVRGLANDVKQTLKTNHERGTLNVIPIIVPFDIEGLNTMNDVAVVSSTDVVSSNKGQLISSLKLTDVVVIDKAYVQSNRVTLFNSRSSYAVKVHLNNLRTKRSEQNVSDISCLLDARIKSMLPNHTVIRMPDDRDFVTRSQSIDNALRSIKSLVDFGTVVVEGKKQLTATVYASAVFTQRCYVMLAALGGVIT